MLANPPIPSPSFATRVLQISKSLGWKVCCKRTSSMRSAFSHLSELVKVFKRGSGTVLKDKVYVSEHLIWAPLVEPCDLLEMAEPVYVFKNISVKALR